MESSRRFRALLSELGLSYPDAAKHLHVSLRTLHNWAAGTHAVPYAVTKLLRVLRYMELPGKSWQGWHFTRGCLVTPEGRTIEGHESSWWSLLVLRAKSFGTLYERQKGLAPVQHPAYSESCTSQTIEQHSSTLVPSWGHSGTTNSIVPPVGNTGGTTLPVAKGPLWPSISDSRPRSIYSPGPTANGSESPSMGLSASPLTRIYNGPKLPLPVPRLRYSLHLSPLPQALPQALRPSPPSLPPVHGISLSSPPSLGCLQSPSPSLAPKLPKRIGQSLRRGISVTRQSSQVGGAA